MRTMCPIHNEPHINGGILCRRASGQYPAPRPPEDRALARRRHIQDDLRRVLDRVWHEGHAQGRLDERRGKVSQSPYSPEYTMADLAEAARITQKADVLLSVEPQYEYAVARRLPHSLSVQPGIHGTEEEARTRAEAFLAQDGNTIVVRRSKTSDWEEF